MSPKTLSVAPLGRLLVGLVGLIVLAGCGGGGSSNHPPTGSPTVSLSPTSLTFVSQSQGTTSTAQLVTLTNTGTANLTLSTVTIGGTNASDFGKSPDTCTGATVSPNNTCTVSVTFTPSAGGSRSASLNFNDNASNSPQTLGLTGTGAAPAVTLSSTSLTFASQTVGTTSAAVSVTVTNSGTATLNFTSIAASGNFSQSNTCGSSLGAGNACTISVTFTPAAPGPLTGTLTLTDNAGNSPQTVSLTGTGVAPAVTLSPTSLTFASQSVGTTSAAQGVTVTNSGNATLTFTTIAASSNFSQTNNCGSSLAAAGTCTINVTFTAPATVGTVNGTVTLTDNAGNSPQTVSLTGTAAPPPPLVSTSSITFGNQAPGTTSASQPAILTNTGIVPLTISSIAVSANFSQTNTCPLSPSSLAAGLSCTINVAFAPPAGTIGTLTGTLTITDNATNSPQTVGLTGTSTGPIVSLTPSSLSFGVQPVATTSTAKIVTLTNTGNATLNVSSLLVTGTNSGDFAQTNTCIIPVAGGNAVAAGSSCVISVTFTPNSSGSRSAAVTITDNTTSSPQTVALTGTGSAPLAGVTPTSLTFSSQNLGTTSAAQTVTLNNTGNASLSITSVALTGTNSGDYAQSNTCGSSVPASGSCTLNVTFAPTASGTRTATLTITDNSNGVAGSTQSVSLTGTGSGAAVSLSAPSIAFGSQTVGVASSPQSVTVTNTGNAILTFTSIAVTGANAADFSLANTCGSSVAANGTCTITVTFTPSVAAAESAAVTLTDNAPGSPQSVSLSGTGVSGLSFSPPSLTFTSQNLGTTSSAQSVTLSNTGSASFTINSISITGANAADFSQTNACGSSLAQGANCAISIKFTPAASGTRTASLSISDSLPGSPQTVALTGTGSGPAAILSGSSLTFASQGLGATSIAQLVTLTNTGNASLSITSISLAGANAGDFAQTNTCGTSVAANGTCTISVTFTPAAIGSRTAAVTITDNSNNLAGSTQSVSLTGTGSAGIAGVSATGLSFSSQNVGTTSTAQTFTLNNTGNAALAISSIAFTGANAGDFGQTNNCGSSVAASASCTFSVTFTPTAIGSRAASLTITDNSNNVPGSTQSVSLSGTGSGAVVSLSAPSIGFGSQTVGVASSAQSVTLTNNGNASLTLTSIAVTGANSADFSQTNTCGSSVAANGTCTISVTFTPSLASAESAAVTLTDNAPGSPQSVSLTGAGVSAVSFSASSLTFTSQNVGTTSSAQSVTMTNTGSASFTISGISITGANATDFAQTNTCGSSLAASNSCAISVTFAPTAAGTRTASVSIADSLPGSPQTVALTGTGAAPAVSLSASSLTFASQGVATTSTAQSVTLTNTGNASLSITSISLAGANAGDFAQTNTCGNSVAAAGTCTISVTFTPGAPGSRTASVSIADNASGSPQTVALTGTGSAPLAGLTTTSLTFSNQTVNTTSTAQTVTLNNTGNAALSISSIAFTDANPGDFGQNNTCGSSVAASGSCNIAVTFTPTASGSRTATLTITDNSNNVAGSTQTVALAGTGAVAVPTVSLSTTTLTLTGLGIGVSSAPQTVTLTNTSSAVLTITNIQVTTGASNFSQTNTCGSSLAAGGNCAINVTFTPSAGGTTTGTLTITDNASTSPQTVALAGLTNAAPLTVNFGPLGAAGGYYNNINTTVTVCSPGSTTNCATIPNVLVDTGSVGLRVLSSFVSGLNLPPALDPQSGSVYPFYECVQFGDLSYTWGPIKMATVQIGGETASQVPGGSVQGVPIQVISSGAPLYVNNGVTQIYNQCLVYYGTSTLTGGSPNDTVAALGANGILGIGNFPQDCGTYCTSGGNPSYSGFPYMVNENGVYYLEFAPLADQAWNPVAALPVDNDGVLLTLPSIPATGAISVNGTLTFGIGTQSNNQIPSGATTYELDTNGNFGSATFNGVTFCTYGDPACTNVSSGGTFIDSGSAGLWVSDAGTLGIPNCGGADIYYYCPSSTQYISLGLTGTNGASGTVSLPIANAISLFNTGNAALNDLAGPSCDPAVTGSPCNVTTDYWDLGLPFFFGQPYGVFVGISGSTQYPQYSNGFWAF